MSEPRSPTRFIIQLDRPGQEVDMSVIRALLEGAGQPRGVGSRTPHPGQARQNPASSRLVTSKCVLDAGGNHAELTDRIARKAGIRLETETGGVMGERPMWAERGEKGTVESSGRIYPGLYVSGMVANAVHGSFRMGPIFGGMFLSGRKVAKLILEELG